MPGERLLTPFFSHTPCRTFIHAGSGEVHKECWVARPDPEAFGWRGKQALEDVVVARIEEVGRHGPNYAAKAGSMKRFLWASCEITRPQQPYQQ
jgi:hypothetical protein